MAETKAVVKATPKKTVQRKPASPKMPTDPNDKLIWLAIQGGAEVEKLEKLIELKNRQEERIAQAEFDKHFAEMQSKFEPVARGKQGDKGKYAPIEFLQKKYNDIIFEHGFSYHWSEEIVDDKTLRKYLHISGYGHTKTNHKDLPLYEPDKGSQSGKPIMNTLQAEGTRSTYGRRYTFIDGFGIIIEDEDTDGSFEDGVQYAEFIRKLDEITDQQKLAQTAREMYHQLRKEGDYKGAEIITKAYNRRKETL